MSDGTSKAGKSIVIILTGLVSLGVGVGSGLLLDLFRDRAPRLTYTTTSAEMFPGAKERTGIVLLQVINSGRREAEDVFCRIGLSGATIREHQVSGVPNVDQLVRTAPAALEVRLPFLNPQEQISFHLLLDLSTDQLAPPAVELRAKGVVGTQDTGREPVRSAVSQVLPISASALAALATALLFIMQLRRRLGIDRLGSAHSDDQRDVFAYILGIHGFNREADEFRRAARSMSYWGAADSLVERWLRSGNREEMERGIAVLTDLLGYASIASSSEDLVRLDMARLAVAVGMLDLATTCVAAIKEPNSRVVKARMAHDARLSALQRAK